MPLNAIFSIYDHAFLLINLDGLPFLVKNIISSWLFAYRIKYMIFAARGIKDTVCWEGRMREFRNLGEIWGFQFSSGFPLCIVMVLATAISAVRRLKIVTAQAAKPR